MQKEVVSKLNNPWTMLLTIGVRLLKLLVGT